MIRLQRQWEKLVGDKIFFLDTLILHFCSRKRIFLQPTARIHTKMAVKSNIITIQEAKKRAKCLKLVLTDNDGVLTDTGVYYSERGEELKRFSIRDGMGVERLRNIGIETAIITGELSGSVKKRSEKLKMPFLYLGVKDKHKELFETVLSQTNLSINQIAYIGDDVNDLEIMREIGQVSLTACPSDATDFVKQVAHYICKAPGGNGAFRDFAEYLIKLRS